MSHPICAYVQCLLAAVVLSCATAVSQGEEEQQAPVKVPPPRRYNAQVQFHNVNPEVQLPDKETPGLDAMPREELAVPSSQMPGGDAMFMTPYQPVKPAPDAERRTKNWLAPDQDAESTEPGRTKSGWGWLADEAQSAREEDEAATGKDEEDAVESEDDFATPSVGQDGMRDDARDGGSAAREGSGSIRDAEQQTTASSIIGEGEVTERTAGSVPRSVVAQQAAEEYDSSDSRRTATSLSPFALMTDEEPGLRQTHEILSSITQPVIESLRPSLDIPSLEQRNSAANYATELPGLDPRDARDVPGASASSAGIAGGSRMSALDGAGFQPAAAAGGFDGNAGSPASSFGADYQSGFSSFDDRLGAYQPAQPLQPSGTYDPLQNQP